MRSRRRLWAVPVLSVIAGLSPLGSATAMAPSCASTGLTVTALHGPRFYTDLSISPQLRGAYAGYRVTEASGTARSNLWVELSSFTGGSVALGGGQPAAQQVAALSAGDEASRFWYLTAASESAAAQQHVVTVWQGRPDLPGSRAVCAASGGFSSVDGTIKAAANKLTSVQVSGGAPGIGTTFTVTVKGDTGTIGAGTPDDPASFWMSPSALGTWAANAYRLEHTSLHLGGATYSDVLRVANLTSGGAYTAVYTFRAVGFTASPTDVLPVQQIASGTQIKHTDTGSAGSLPPIQPAVNALTVSADASPDELPAAGGTVQVSVEVEGPDGATLDDVTDVLPSGASYVAGSATWQGSATSDPVVDGDRLVFQGPFLLAPGPDLVTFEVALPGDPGDHVNSVSAHVGDALLDTTLALTDDAPATTTVNVDAPPVAADDTASAYSGDPATLEVLGNDVDADGDVLTLTGVGIPEHGTATVSGRRVVYTPDPAYQGPDSFSYTVADDRGGSDTGTVTVQVSRPPAATATDDTATVQPGQTATLDVLDNDTGSGLTIVSVTGVGAQVSADGRQVEYTAPVAPGTYQVQYTVEDSSGNASSATVTVTVPPAPALDGPIAVGDQVTTVAGRDAAVDVLDNDTGSGLTVHSASHGSHGTTAVRGGTVSYSPARDFVGDDSFTYTVLDGAGSTASADVSVHVEERPAGVGDEATTDWDSTVAVAVTANDPHGSEVAEVVAAPSHGHAAVADTGSVTYTPARTFTGTDSFSYRLVGTRQAVPVTVIVGAAALELQDDTVTTTRPEGPVGVPVLGNDTGTDLRVVQVSAPRHGTTRIGGTGRVVFTPAADRTGPETFRYTVEDVVGQTSQATVTVNVLNLSPTLAPLDAVRAVAGGRVHVVASTSDADGDSLRLRLGTPSGTQGAHPADEALSDATSGNASDGTGTVDLRLSSAFTGELVVPVTVVDGHGGQATRKLRLTVSPQPVVGVSASLAPNAEADDALAKPRFVDGRPQSRMLSTSVATLVVWERSPTESVRAYQVRVDGEPVCTVAASRDSQQHCRLEDRVLRSNDRVSVRAVGAGDTLSEPDRVPVRTHDEGHLLAVVYFPSGEFYLDRAARTTLAQLAKRAGTAGYDTVTMIGHTDSQGSQRSNAVLSRDRAHSVKEYLLARFGSLSVSRTGGHGETRPVADNRTTPGRAANRRVEIYVGW